MTKDKKIHLLVSLKYRDHLVGLTKNQKLLFWKEFPLKKEDLISWVKKNGLPKKKKTENLRLGLGVDYYFDNGKGKWVIDFYERGGPIGSKTVKDSLDVVKILISDEFALHIH